MDLKVLCDVVYLAENGRSTMKKILDWITYILNLVVAVPVIAVVSFMVMALNAYLAVAVCVALFGFWAFYQYYNVIQKRPLFKNNRKPLLLLIVIIILAAIPVCFVLNGIGRPSRVRNIQAEGYSQALAASKSSKWLMARMIPEDATEIEFFHRPGFRGAYAYLKCSCTMEGLKAFGLSQGYDFQVDDMSKNADSANPTTATPFRMVLEHFHAEETDRLHELKNYRAYKCIHRNGGGFAFLYLVEKQILYGWYASN